MSDRVPLPGFDALAFTEVICEDCGKEARVNTDLLPQMRYLCQECWDNPWAYRTPKEEDTSNATQ